jgi:site-specific DNA-methyltransferase (adenine-specific)
VSKAIDKAAGAAREVIGDGPFARRKPNGSAGVNSVGLSSNVGSVITYPATDAARAWEGWGTALKPAVEPICLARKPLSEPTVAANCLKWGTGAINVDACRIEGETPSVERRAAAAKSGNYGRLGDKTNGEIGKMRANGDRQAGLANYLAGKSGDALGRWPANLVHDGSPEVLAGFPVLRGPGNLGGTTGDGIGYGSTSHQGRLMPAAHDVGGSAARFFYSAKADADGRIGSKHPTVKPVDLMQWLVRLITPPGGTVLDCFAGTGTTGEAALREGFRAILIEREAEYQADIARRMAHVFAPDRERRQTITVAKGKTETAGPLFDHG